MNLLKFKLINTLLNISFHIQPDCFKPYNALFNFRKLFLFEL